MFDLFLESLIIRTHWRGGRVAEGAPLLREYLVCSRIEGSNPSLSAIIFYSILFIVNNGCEERKFAIFRLRYKK